MSIMNIRYNDSHVNSQYCTIDTEYFIAISASLPTIDGQVNSQPDSQSIDTIDCIIIAITSFLRQGQ